MDQTLEEIVARAVERGNAPLRALLEEALGRIAGPQAPPAADEAAREGPVTATELARLLKKRPATIQKWAREGMPAYRYGRCLLFNVGEVLAWMRAQKAEAQERRRSANGLDVPREAKWGRAAR
jgi:hypothetical protein